MVKDLSSAKRALATLVAVGGLLAACANASAWQVNVNGSLSNASDGAEAVVLDAGGNVIAAGFTQNTSSGLDFTVVKFLGTTGVELWRRVLDGNGTGGGFNDFDSANAVAVDAAGNVVAAGFTSNGGASDFTVVKLASSTGAELWRQTINGDGNSADQAVGVVVDGAGDVVAAGPIVQNTGNLGGFTVVKFAGSTGAELWRQVIHGSANGAHAVVAIAADAAGNIVAAGYTVNTGTSLDFTVIKFAGSTGAELWRQTLNGTANGADAAYAVTIDHAGDVLAAGVTQNVLGGNGFTVAKFTGNTGALLWRKVIKGTKSLKGANGDDEAFALAVDAVGDVVAGGMTQNEFSGHDFTVVKLSGVNGAEQWTQIIHGTMIGEDQVRAVAVDRNGDAVAAGFIQNAATSYDFAVVKLAGASGAPLWQKAIHGTAAPSGSELESAAAVATDSAGNVVVAGTTQNAGTFFDFTVVKLNGADGSSYCVKLTCIRLGL